MKLIQALSLSILFSANVGIASQYESPYSLMSSEALNFAAPSVYSRTNLSEASVGTIIYDSNAGAFFGLTPAGAPSSSGSWIQLGGTTDSGSVDSNGSSERIERATLSNSGSCAVTSQSGTWITGVSDPGTGICTMSITGFSAAPSCTCSQINGESYVCNITAISSASITTQIESGAGTSYDRPFSIICMGPR